MSLCLSSPGEAEITDIKADSSDGSIIVTNWATSPHGTPPYTANAYGSLSDNGIDPSHKTITGLCADGGTYDDLYVEVTLADGLSRGESDRFLVDYTSGGRHKSMRIGLRATLTTDPPVIDEAD